MTASRKSLKARVEDDGELVTEGVPVAKGTGLDGMATADRRQITALLDVTRDDAFWVAETIPGWEVFDEFLIEDRSSLSSFVPEMWAWAKDGIGWKSARWSGNTKKPGTVCAKVAQHSETNVRCLTVATFLGKEVIMRDKLVPIDTLPEAAQALCEEDPEVAGFTWIPAPWVPDGQKEPARRNLWAYWGAAILTGTREEREGLPFYTYERSHIAAEHELFLTLVRRFERSRAMAAFGEAQFTDGAFLEAAGRALPAESPF